MSEIKRGWAARHSQYGYVCERDGDLQFTNVLRSALLFLRKRDAEAIASHGDVEEDAISAEEIEIEDDNA